MEMIVERSDVASLGVAIRRGGLFAPFRCLCSEPLPRRLEAAEAALWLCGACGQAYCPSCASEMDTGGLCVFYRSITKNEERGGCCVKSW
jgi:hypothetical protein